MTYRHTKKWSLKHYVLLQLLVHFRMHCLASHQYQLQAIGLPKNAYLLLSDIWQCQISDKSRYAFLWPLNISVLLTQIIPPKLSPLILDDPAKSLLSQWPRHILSILGSFYQHGLTDIRAWISNYSKQFSLRCNDPPIPKHIDNLVKPLCAVEVRTWMSNEMPLFCV